MELKIDKKRKKAGKPDQSRRNFFMIFSLFIGSLIGIAITFPLIGFLFHPLRRKTVYSEDAFIRIGNINELTTEIPKKLTVSSFKVDGWNLFDNIILGATWLIKRDSGDVIAMSTICPHLGCGIDWNTEKKQFVCPCHESVFDIKGKLVSGPAPRSMDTLETKIEGDDIFVKYRKLKLGTSGKVEV